MFRKMRVYAAAAVAFLIGMPLTEQAFAASVGNIISASVGLAGAIVDSAGRS